MAETLKAKNRRLREGFFEKYCQGIGIDIGCGSDPITETCVQWDKQEGDATLMEGVADDSFNWVHSSHCLEHIDFPHIALKNWVRVLKPGGYLLLLLPHRRLYEHRLTLPSQFNGDHRHFWLPDRDEPPCTIGLVPFVSRWLGTAVDLIYVKTCDEGWVPCPPEQHACGEYSIEAVYRKF